MENVFVHAPKVPSRRTPRVWRPSIRAYAVAVGELIWAANRTQSSLGDLFSVLVDAKHLDPGLAIWHSIGTDKGQLSALQALLKTRSASSSRLFRCTQWAITATEKLSEIRNDAAHMATSPQMTSAGLQLVPNPIGNTPSRLSRRQGTEFLELFSKARGDYVLVQQYVHAVFCHLAYPTERYPLPLRPRLHAVVIRPRRK